MIETLKDVFNSVYLKEVGFEYNFGNKNVEKELQTFLSKIPQGAGEDWLFDFTIFQFAYYNGMKTRFNRIYLNWIYGTKALKRWSERTDAQLWHASIYKLKLGIVKQTTALSATEYKDNERRRFNEMSRQILHCDFLDLFNCNSKVCTSCSLFVTCLNK